MIKLPPPVAVWGKSVFSREGAGDFKTNIYRVSQNACPSRALRPMHKTKMLPKI